MHRRFASRLKIGISAGISLLLINATGWGASYKVLKALYALDSKSPIGGLVMDSAGNLYGTGSGHGGPAGTGYGGAFILKPTLSGPWMESALHIFAGNKGDAGDGKRPIGALVFDEDGNLYGTTGFGGSGGEGTVFELTPTEKGLWTETLLYQFTGTDGNMPNPLIRDATGTLYGTTQYGGASGHGVAFSLSPAIGGGYTYQVLHNFAGGTSDGAYPMGPLIRDQSGNLYGVAEKQGKYGYGVVYSLSPLQDGTWSETVLYSFNNFTGSQPMGGLVMDAAGNLYGTTDQGINFLGLVFELSPTGHGGWSEKELYRFSGPDGANPEASLTMDAAGNLYGTTFKGGTNSQGTIFELSPTATGTWNETVLHSFGNEQSGQEPQCQLVLDAAGNLYGTTYHGGLDNAGVVFEITP